MSMMSSLVSLLIVRDTFVLRTISSKVSSLITCIANKLRHGDGSSHSFQLPSVEGGYGDDATLQKSLKTHNGDKNESIHYVDKEKYWNRLDEEYGCLTLSISQDILFHINGLKNPKDIWDKLASLFEKKDDLRIY